MTEDVIRKVCMLGNPAVGKTSLVRKFVYDEFDDKYISTIGTKVTKKVINFAAKDLRLTLMLWDVLGQRTRKLNTLYFRGAKGALLVFDGTRRDTFDSLDEWIDTFYTTVGEVPLVILGNKNDLPDWQVTEGDFKEFVASKDAVGFLTSAQTGIYVEDAFLALARKLI
jgi:small GTP-binding protein